MKAALRAAIIAAGGSSAVAVALNIRPQAVSQWGKAPAARVIDLERISGISRHVLRPDVFGPAPADEAAA